MKNRIRELRKEHHMTQIRLSIELEVTQETVSAYESGKHHPSIAILLKLHELFNVSCDYILGISDVKIPQKNESLEKDEHHLLDGYKQLDAQKKELLRAYLDGLRGVPIKQF